jgi:xanthine dehydrogenase iron-sulfur cluster and FAD-binding subunit A
MTASSAPPAGFLLNGQFVSLKSVETQAPLSQLVRRLGFTGTKEGCAEGDCGACTVLVSDHDAHGAAVRARVGAVAE